MSRTFVYVLLNCLAVTVGVCSSPLLAQPIHWDSLESPLPCWKLHSSDAPHHIVRHQRIRDVVHSGDWAESISIAAQRGSQIYLAHHFGQAPIIEELQLALWLRADRPGMQIAARVVLPRTADPRSGKPLTVLVYGNLYRDVGTWQRLFIDKLPQRVAEQVRILRSGGTSNIDAKEAYVDRLLINTYGGVGTTNIWIDDVEIVGLVGGVADSWPAEVALAGFTGSTSPAGAPREATVQMRGAVLWAEGLPFFPRIIEYRGEPLSRLRELGFNTVQLNGPPSSDLQAEATRLGLWLICPPPADTAAANLPAALQRVLAWHVGSQLTRDDLHETIQEVRRLRSADPALRRPILCSSQTELRAFSRHADALLADRDPIGSSLELTDYASWLRHIQLLARPATPIWVRIQSDYAPAWQRQLAALAEQPIAPSEVCYAALRQQVFLAIAQGARGLYFSSRGPLNADNPLARRRALALELINLELQLLETWAAAGQVAAPANSNQPAITAALLQSERGRLLLPLRSAGGSQYVTTAAPQEGVKFIVPGVPPSNRAYLVTLAGLEPLPQRRVTGGNHISLENPDRVTAILMTEDPVVVDRLSRTVERIRRRAAELKCRLAAEEFSGVEDVEHRLAAETGTDAPADALEPVRQQVKQCQSALAAGETKRAVQYSSGVLSELDRVRRRSWNTAIRQLGHPSQLPLLATHAGLPLAYERTRALRGARWGENQLTGGEMENLDGMLAAGWRHVRLTDDPMASQVELSAARPHSGRRSLHLHVQRGNDLAPEFVEAPPLWIVSPPVPLRAGQIVRIEGWAWVPAPVTATADGLLIFDSVAGPSMAKRIGQTSGWQQFTLYRAATSTGPMSVTIALAGIGDAWVDDVTLRPLSRLADR